MRPDIEVTDHALVRYLERVHGMDMEFFRQCVKFEIENFEKEQGVVYREPFSWLFMQNKLVSVVRGNISFRQFMDDRLT